MEDKKGRCFDEIHQRVIWVSGVWKQHQQLFQKDRKTALLLERSARLFFNIVYEELWDSVLLWLSKLLDEAVTGTNNKNLTLGALAAMGNEPALQERYESLKVLAKVIRKQRDKRIAHLDRPYALRAVHDPDQLIAANDVDAVLAGIHEFMEVFRESHGMPRYGYTQIYWCDGAEELVKTLWSVEANSWEGLKDLGIYPPE
ncbi:MAG: hypothetical protein ACI4NW_11080 [Stenotrophomonas sp.]